MNKIKETLKKLNIFDYFILLSPFIDLITSQAAYKSESTLTLGMIVRFGFLAIMLLYLIFKNKSKYKKKSIIYISILITFGIINLTNSYFLKGSSVMIEEIKYMIKAFYFPIMLVISLNYFSDKNTKVNDKVLYITGMVYAFFIFLAFLIEKPFGFDLLGTGFYPGWFFSANEISAMFGLISPFIIFLTIKNYKKIYMYPLFIMFIVSALLLKTSVPSLGIAISSILLLVIIVIKHIVNKEQKIIKKGTIISVILVFLISAFFLTDFIKKDYNFTDVDNDKIMTHIFSNRNDYNKLVLNKYKSSNIKEKLIGMGYIDIESIDGRRTNNTEIDYTDIFYPYGIVGFIIYFCVFTYLIFKIITYLIINFKKTLASDNLIPFYISICLIIGIAFFAGHTLTAPAVSIYVSILTAYLYLTINKKEKNNKKSIMFVSQHYYPENFKVTDICEELVKEGKEVTILTGLPNYPTGRIPKEYRWFKKRKENINGVKVIRASLIRRKKGAIGLSINYLSFMITSSFKSLFINKNFDVIVVYQLSPITMAIPGVILKKLTNKPLYLYCCDIWPESAKNMIKNEKGIAFKILFKLSKYIYSQCDKISVTSKPFVSYFTDVHGINKNKISYIPQHSDDINLGKGKTKDSNINFVFMGNIGIAQDIETILKACEKIKNVENFKVHFVGEGSYLERAKEITKEKKLNDIVIFHGRHPSEKMIDFYNLADACLLTLNSKNLVGLTMPGKLQGYMAAGKPVIGAINGAAQEVIKEARCGLCANSGDYKKLAAYMKDFILKPEKYKECGLNGRKYYEDHFTKDQFMLKLNKELDSLLEEKNV